MHQALNMLSSGAARGKRRRNRLVVGLAILGTGAFAGAAPAGRQPYQAPQASQAPVLDGRPDDACWARAEWRPLDQRWVGPPTTAADFAGRYKVVWTPQRLYVLAEITDDRVVDTHADPLEKWWDDDCLEIFVDPDHSGGGHQYNYNAWAYHVALDGHVVDMGRDQKGHLYDEHVQSRHRRQGQVTTWETAVALYADTYNERQPAANKPLTIKPGRPIGFALAYCDNDGSPERENFFGSEVVAGADKNRGWIDAGIFGTLLPVAAPAARPPR